ncbi:hypothetical protein [Streptomyces sp. MAR4 CNX-425]|uniref:hypothetical protein n=1 Tax=Streptomyces sp. MAR4 CNX-425 TaxID=3406343 RepID=UPI003B508977
MPPGAGLPGGAGAAEHRGRLLRLARARRMLIAVGVAVAVLGGGLGAWAAGAGPFEDPRHCWGAWQDRGEGGFFSGHGSRSGTDDPPTPERPRGTCTVVRTIASVEQTLKVTYGPAPEDPAERMEWLGDALFPDAVPLPDGLPGVVDAGNGLLVLPERCDTADGRPTAVRMEGTDGREQDYGTPHSLDLGGTREAAVLLTAAANRGMELAGCADGEPLRTTSPVLTLPPGDESGPHERTCGIPGLGIQGSEALLRRLRPQVGTVTRQLQTCSVTDPPRFTGKPRRKERLHLGLAMIAEPRLAALAGDAAGAGAPARGWRGTGAFTTGHALVRAECAGRPTTFLMLTETDAGTGARPDYFTAFTDAVTQRLGCAPLAPGRTGR